MRTFKDYFRDREGSQTSQDRTSRVDQPRADATRTARDGLEKNAAPRLPKQMTLGEVFAGRRSSE